MRILVDQSGYYLENMGDLAMLQTTISRLQNLWSNASIQVFTTAPHLLQKHCPNVTPLSPLGRDIWFYPLLNGIYKLIPNRGLVQKSLNFEKNLRNCSPSLVSTLLKTKLKRHAEISKEVEVFFNAIYNSDLVIASGGGYITDVFKDHANSVLNTLELGSQWNKPTVMFGQGLGPIQDCELYNKTKEVLSKVDLIALRERRSGIPLLQSMNISDEKILTTGDDAIEFAYQFHNSTVGDGLGINLRVAQYSKINPNILNIVRAALHKVASQHNSPLYPIPIDHTFNPGYVDPDFVTIQKLLEGYDSSSDGGKSLDTPAKVAEKVTNCRVVVTGSYHAGVFALSQGIPVVALAKSQYYVDKFLGLSEQFGAGCEVLLLSDENLEEKLIARINHAWQLAEDLKPRLLMAASNQINLSRAAYQKAYMLLNGR
jgi:polysaccharide pyruvyl transferase WcaK-like protein